MVVLPEGVLPATQNHHRIERGPICRWSWTARRTVCSRSAAIDNLNRGTAGQAVQSLNIALGLLRIRD